MVLYASISLYLLKELVQSIATSGEKGSQTSIAGLWDVYGDKPQYYVASNVDIFGWKHTAAPVCRSVFNRMRTIPTVSITLFGHKADAEFEFKSDNLDELRKIMDRLLALDTTHFDRASVVKGWDDENGEPLFVDKDVIDIKTLMKKNFRAVRFGETVISEDEVEDIIASAGPETNVEFWFQSWIEGGSRGFVKGFQQRSTPLKHLKISSALFEEAVHDDEQIGALIDFLTDKNKPNVLKTLELDEGVFGPEEAGLVLLTPRRFEALRLSSCKIHTAGLEAFRTGLQCGTLPQALNICPRLNGGITEANFHATMMDISRSLANPSCTMTDWSVCFDFDSRDNYQVASRQVEALVRGLRGNKSLKRLVISATGASSSTNVVCSRLWNDVLEAVECHPTLKKLRLGSSAFLALAKDIHLLMRRKIDLDVEKLGGIHSHSREDCFIEQKWRGLIERQARHNRNLQRSRTLQALTNLEERRHVVGEGLVRSVRDPDRFQLLLTGHLDILAPYLPTRRTLSGKRRPLGDAHAYACNKRQMRLPRIFASISNKK